MSNTLREVQEACTATQASALHLRDAVVRHLVTQGASQRQVARDLGLSHQMVSKIVKGGASVDAVE